MCVVSALVSARLFLKDVQDIRSFSLEEREHSFAQHFIVHRAALSERVLLPVKVAFAVYCVKYRVR